MPNFIKQAQEAFNAINSTSHLLDEVQGYDYNEDLFYDDEADPLKLIEADQHYQNLVKLVEKCKSDAPEDYPTCFLFEMQSIALLLKYYAKLNDVSLDSGFSARKYYRNISEEYRNPLIQQSSELPEIMHAFAQATCNIIIVHAGALEWHGHADDISELEEYLEVFAALAGDDFNAAPAITYQYAKAMQRSTPALCEYDEPVLQMVNSFYAEINHHLLNNGSLVESKLFSIIYLEVIKGMKNLTKFYIDHLVNEEYAQMVVDDIEMILGQKTLTKCDHFAGLIQLFVEAKQYVQQFRDKKSESEKSQSSAINIYNEVAVKMEAALRSENLEQLRTITPNLIIAIEGLVPEFQKSPEAVSPILKNGIKSQLLPLFKNESFLNHLTGTIPLMLCRLNQQLVQLGFRDFDYNVIRTFHDSVDKLIHDYDFSSSEFFPEILTYLYNATLNMFGIFKNQTHGIDHENKNAEFIQQAREYLEKTTTLFIANPTGNFFASSIVTSLNTLGEYYRVVKDNKAYLEIYEMLKSVVDSRDLSKDRDHEFIFSYVSEITTKALFMQDIEDKDTPVNDIEAVAHYLIKKCADLKLITSEDKNNSLYNGALDSYRIFEHHDFNNNELHQSLCHALALLSIHAIEVYCSANDSKKAVQIYDFFTASAGRFSFMGFEESDSFSQCKYEVPHLLAKHYFFDKQDFDKARMYFEKSVYQCEQASIRGVVNLENLLDSLNKAVLYFKQNKIKGKTREYTMDIKKLKKITR